MSLIKDSLTNLLAEKCAVQTRCPRAGASAERARLSGRAYHLAGVRSKPLLLASPVFDSNPCSTAISLDIFFGSPAFFVSNPCCPCDGNFAFRPLFSLQVLAFRRFRLPDFSASRRFSASGRFSAFRLPYVFVDPVYPLKNTLRLTKPKRWFSARPA